MTDLTLTRGDSRNYELTILESDGVTPVDLTDAILKFAAKRRPSDTNDDAEIFKTTYDPAEIQITDALNGQAVIRVLIADTVSLSPGVLRWDLEVTRRGSLSSSAGTLSATTGSEILQGTGLDFDAIRVGDIVVPGGPLNTTPFTITAIDRDLGTITAGGLTTLVTESGITHQTFSGNRKTPDGLSGCLTLLSDVVT